MDYFVLYFKELLALSNEMSPYLILGFLFGGILHVLIPQNKLQSFMGGNNLKSVINASLFGIPLPLCSCGVIPTGISFYKNGVSKGGTVSFFISTPQTGVDSIFVTYSLLGLPFAILRPIIAFISAIFGGVLTNQVDKNEDINEIDPKILEDSEHIKRNKFTRILSYAFIELMENIAKWLLIGLMLAALISLVIPNNFFSMHLKNDYLSMLLVLVAAIPLYVCATGSVPITAVLLLKGISPGAAIVFLMAGPATNIATMTIIGKVMGKRSLFTYLSTIILSAFFFGTIINEFIPREWLLNTIPGNHLDHTAHHILPEWLKLSSTIFLALLIIYNFTKRFFIKSESSINKNDMIKKYSVKGMTCNHCIANVENNINKIEGVISVKANLNTSQVNIEGEDVSDDQIKKAVEDIGYKFEGKIK